jgi:hypothetical protein
MLNEAGVPPNSDFYIFKVVFIDPRVLYDQLEIKNYY